MEDGIRVFFVLVSVGLAGAFVYASIATVNVIVHRIKGAKPDVSPDELEYLRDRAEQVDLLVDRVSELETRLDFAERLLTRPDETRHDTPVGSN
jgi:hypothetical protein